MPPNRKTSTLSDDFLLSSRLRLANHLQPTVVTAKDAVVVVQAVDDVESYWHWPAAASIPPVPHETARNNDQKKKKKANVVVDLFSAHHIVANLVREASLQEEEQQQQRQEPPREHADDNGPTVSSSSTTTATTTIIIDDDDDDDNDHKRTYWDWTRPATTIDPAHIEDRWTSGPAMERNLVRDAAATTITTITTTTTPLVADHDTAWDWVTFPCRAAERKFSHDHYERHLVLRHSSALSSCGTNNTSGRPVVVVPMVHHHDDYWHGL